ncbi:MAG: hypothetical protein ACFFB2_09505 [Promethearchaeota archaeon]
MTALVDLESILTDFSEEMKRDLRFIHSLSLIPAPKVAFHAADADGVISASILKALKEFKTAVFIPLRYQVIHHYKFNQFLASLNWIAIVDLPPFNESNIALYIDHHFSNKSRTKNAEVVLFDEKAPSAAYLLCEYFKDRLPESLKILADLTTITDTAGFTIPPPEKYTPNFLEATRQEQAWLLDDICRTPESVQAVFTLVQDISQQGLDIFNNMVYQQKIFNLRTLRKKSREIGDRFDLAEVIIIIQGKERIMTSALVHKLFEKGVKISCFIFPGKKFTGISLRVNPNVPESELERCRVDHLAKKFSGGGHPRAAGGRGTSLQTTLIQIFKWIQEQAFTSKEYDLRKTAPFFNKKDL